MIYDFLAPLADLKGGVLARSKYNKQTLTPAEMNWLNDAYNCCDRIKECIHSAKQKETVADIFEQITRELIKRPRLIIVDEIDYLTQEKSTIEMLRDIHDRTHTPIILIGMSYADKKIKRYKHLYDRLSEILQFQKFSIEDIKNLINELSEIKFDNSAIEHIQNTENRFRQIVKIIDKAENYARANDLSIITLKDMRFLLK